MAYTVHDASLGLLPMLGPVCGDGGGRPLALLWPALAMAALHCAPTLAGCGLLAGVWRLAAYFTRRRVSG